jgi:hypothetical protein
MSIILNKNTISGSGNSDFINQLKKINLSPTKYLNQAKKEGVKNGYNASNLFLSNKPNYKLIYKNDDNKFIHFGRVGFGDFIIWNHLEKKGLVRDGYALQKKNTFEKSHSKIIGNWEHNKYSPNNLALNINW